MSEQTIDVVQDAGGDRYLNVAAVRVHNNHLQEGKPSSGSCGMCGEGLESAINTLEEITVPSGYVELVPGDGIDRGGDATPSSDPGTNPSGTLVDQLLGSERGLRDPPVHETFR